MVVIIALEMAILLRSIHRGMGYPAIVAS